MSLNKEISPFIGLDYPPQCQVHIKRSVLQYAVAVQFRGWKFHLDFGGQIIVQFDYEILCNITGCCIIFQEIE